MDYLQHLNLSQALCEVNFNNFEIVTEKLDVIDMNVCQLVYEPYQLDLNLCYESREKRIELMMMMMGSMFYIGCKIRVS